MPWRYRSCGRFHAFAPVAWRPSECFLVPGKPLISSNGAGIVLPEIEEQVKEPSKQGQLLKANYSCIKAQLSCITEGRQRE
jgi:hypothetical protein